VISPDKFTGFDDSLLALAPRVLERLSSPMPLSRLRRECRRVVSSTIDFVVIIDVLFLLDAVDVDMKTGEICRAG